MKATYTYKPTPAELFTRQVGLHLNAGDKVRIATANHCGLGKLPAKYRWVDDLNGNFLGMVCADSLVKDVIPHK